MDMNVQTPITDRFGRTVDYLRVSVTDFCNMRCRYCMGPDGVAPLGHDEILRFEEIRDIVRYAASFGVRKVRLTGGEPLVRKHLADLVAMLAGLPGIDTLAMSTNGTMLADHADRLRAAGLDSVNIGIDSMRPEVFERIARRDLCDRAVAGIDAARRVGFDPVKLNVVVMRGINDDEIGDFIGYGLANAVEVRFIEYMPHQRDLDEGKDLFIDAEEMLDRVRACADIVPVERPARSGPADVYVVKGTDTRIGVIPSVSRPACSQCNRLRLRADGQLVACLYEGGMVDIKTLIRANAADETIREAFQQAANLKPRIHSAARTTHMSRLGG